MALTIDNPEVERLARELARKRGEIVEQTVLTALRAEIAGLKPTRFAPDGSAYRALTEFQESLAPLPVLDPRPPDELLGYDESGLRH